jgi:hypothetical protein
MAARGSSWQLVVDRMSVAARHDGSLVAARQQLVVARWQLGGGLVVARWQLGGGLVVARWRLGGVSVASRWRLGGGSVSAHRR